MKIYALIFAVGIQLIAVCAIAGEQKPMLSLVKPYAVTLSVKDLQQTAK